MTIARDGSKQTPAGFPSPFDVSIPPSCEGWEEMYPLPHALRRGSPDVRGEPLLVPERAPHGGAALPVRRRGHGLGGRRAQPGERPRVRRPSLPRRRIPDPQRLRFNSANSVTDAATLEQRAELFTRRGGYYYEHWDELYERWVEKVEAATAGAQGARGARTARRSKTRPSSPRAGASARAISCSSPTTGSSRGSIASSSTTSSSSTSATGPTSSSMSSAGRHSPTSTTR